MIQPLLQSHLEPVARRLRRVRLLRAFTGFWVGATLAGTALVVIGRLVDLPPLFLIAGVFTGAGVAAFIVHQRLTKWNPDYRQIARDIEANHPDLHALLLTAVEQRPDAQTGELNFLQQRVIDQALEETRRRNFIDTVPTEELGRVE